MDILVWEKALNAVKTIMMVSVCLNLVAVIVGLLNCIEGGKFNAKLR